MCCDQELVRTRALRNTRALPIISRSVKPPHPTLFEPDLSVVPESSRAPQTHLGRRLRVEITTSVGRTASADFDESTPVSRELSEGSPSRQFDGDVVGNDFGLVVGENSRLW